MKLHNIGLSLCCIVAALGAAPGIAAVGKFQFVTGDVRLTSKSGESRAAVKGLGVEEGDTVASGQPAMAQIRMNDGGVLVIRPNTRLIVKAFQFSGKEDGNERAHFSLEKGSVRAITGEIGKTNKQNYLIQTPSASIGVRGTDHEPYAVDATQGGPAAQGTYDRVNVGATIIENAKGNVIVNPGQVGYAADAATAPVILPEVPALYSAAGGTVQVAKRGSQSAARASSASSGGGGDSGGAVAQPLRTADGLNLSAAPPAPEPLPPPPPPPPSVDSGLRTPTIASYVAIGEHGTISQKVEGTRTFATNNATVLDGSGGTQPFRISWGRWENGFTLPNTQFVGSAHFVNSPETTNASQFSQLQFSKEAEYQLFGGSRPTNALGATGSLDKLSVAVDFATQRISRYELEVTMPPAGNVAASSQWTATGNGRLLDFIGNGMDLQVRCVSCRDAGQTALGTGRTKGAFVGPNAEALLNAFGLRVDNHTVSGVAALQRTVP